MRNVFKVLASIIFALGMASSVWAAPGNMMGNMMSNVVVVVDKKTNQLHLAHYLDGKLDVFKTFRATMGQKIGDKMVEGDMRTPEGIYEFLFRKDNPPNKLLGPLAIYVSYPNVMDKTGAKTGFDIMVHGTDDPSRLERKFDSHGCVVLDNDNVRTVAENVAMHDTKIVITRDFSQLQDPERLEKAKKFFNRWITAWSAKDIDTYVDSYADEYKMDGMNRLQYAKYKESLNKKYGTISVKAEDPHFYFHEKYDLITFTQVYDSTFPNGKPAYHGVSKKNLYIQDRNGHYKIVVEETRK